MTSILEKLERRKAVHGVTVTLANPDGPEASKVIRELVEALEGISYLAKHRVGDGDDLGANVWRMTLTDIEAEANEALSKVKVIGGVSAHD